MSIQETSATFGARANLVLVPVAVRDARGNSVGTLTQPDFQLFDKGKRQTITRFSLENSTGEKSPGEKSTGTSAQANAANLLPEHFVAFLFDDLHLTTSDLLQARAAATRYFSAKADAATRFAIYTTSGHWNLDFTDDRAQLLETIAKIQPRAATKSEYDCPSIDFYLGDLIENKNDPEALAIEINEARACAPIAAAPGPATQGQIGVDPLELLVRYISARVVREGEFDTRLALRVLSDLVRRMGSAPGSRTIVLVSPGFLLTETHREESDVMDRAVRSNVVVSGVDVRGLFVTDVGVAAAKAKYDHDAAMTQADVLAEVTGGTGGLYVHNTNDLDGGLLRASQNPEFHYVLGFTPQDLKFDGSFHPIKVSISGSGYSLQARRGYYAPLHSDDPESVAKEEIEEALFSRDERRDFPVDLNTQFFKANDTQAKLSVVVRLEPKNVHFRKVDGRSRDKLTILSGLFDRNGNYITGVEKVLEMNLREETLQSITRTGIIVRSGFDVPPGGYVVRLVVRDAEGQALAARNGTVEIP